MDSDAQEQPKAVFPSEGRATDQMSIEGQNKNCDPMPLEELGRGHPSNFSTCYGTDNSTVGNNSTAAVNSTCHSTAGKLIRKLLWLLVELVRTYFILYH